MTSRCQVLAFALTVLLLSGCGRRTSQAPAEPEVAVAAVIDSFGRRLVDITEPSGLDFRQVNGRDGRKLLPETLGAGAGFLDYDGDGNLDIFLVNGTRWSDSSPDAPRGRCALFRGTGDGRFVDVSAKSGADIEVQGMGCTIADHDGDGDDDIYVTTVFDNVLLVNEGGVFRDGTRAAGLAGGRWRDAEGVEHPEWSTAAAFLDVDRDGDLDLFVANYCRWTIATDIFTTLDGRQKAFTTPEHYQGLPCRLYLGDGAGKFEEAPADSGLADSAGKALGLAIWDLDGDGLEEILVANDTRPNFYFANLGGGKFAERGVDVGIAYDDLGRARAGMGIDIAVLADDGVPAVAIGNFAFEPVSLYRRRSDGGFDPRAARAGLAVSTLEPLTFGLLFEDIDLDGALDLVTVNGHIEPDIAGFSPGQDHAQSAQIHRGSGDGRFTFVSSLAIGDLALPLVGRGLYSGDIDHDGDLDLLVTSNGGPARLFRNDAASGSAPTRSLTVTLAQEGGNRRALGARLRLITPHGVMERRLRTGSSYLGQSEITAVFGLPVDSGPLRIEILWPDGVITERAIDATETRIEVRR